MIEFNHLHKKTHKKEADSNLHCLFLVPGNQIFVAEEMASTLSSHNFKPKYLFRGPDSKLLTLLILWEFLKKQL